MDQWSLPSDKDGATYYVFYCRRLILSVNYVHDDAVLSQVVQSIGWKLKVILAKFINCALRLSIDFGRAL